MTLPQRIQALAAEHPHLWTTDACGVTRSDTQIPVLLHPDAYVPDTARARVLLLSGLTAEARAWITASACWTPMWAAAMRFSAKWR